MPERQSTKVLSDAEKIIFALSRRGVASAGRRGEFYEYIKCDPDVVLPVLLAKRTSQGDSWKSNLFHCRFSAERTCHHRPTSCHQTWTLNSQNSRRSTDHGPGLCLGRRAGSWKTNLSGMYTRFRCAEQHTRNWNRPGSSRMLQTPWYAQHAYKAVGFKQWESTSGARGRKPSSLHPTAEKSSLIHPAGSCCVQADRWR